MTDTLPVALTVLAGAVLFALFWFLVTCLLARLSGWPALERLYPDRAEQPLASLGFQSARMRGVHFGNCLRFDVCPSGLRLAMMRLFGPLRRPVFIPWEAISAQRARYGLLRAVRMGFDGADGDGIVIRERSFWRIAERCPVASLRAFAEELNRRERGRR